MSKVHTPLRYPGGKQRLAPFILEIIEANDLVNGHYAEAYAGGAGVALELLLNNKVSHVHLNDISLPIYSFWKSVKEHTEELCKLITSASLTVEEWEKRREIVRNPQSHTPLEIGYSTFYLNRCNRSGVISGGLIGGINQSGKWKMDARFSRNELIRRIEAIASKADKISLYNLDAETFIVQKIPALPINSLIYCDPPYFEKSSKLYLNKYQKEDHERIAQVIQEKLHRKWVLSYDSAPQLVEYYGDRRSFIYDLQYNASRVYKGKEVFIFSDDLLIPSNSSLAYIDNSISQELSRKSIKWCNPISIQKTVVTASENISPI